MEGVECDVCFHQYNEDERQPRTLNCGHTLCTVCVTDGIIDGKLKCPFCREAHDLETASAIPVTFSLLKVVRTLSAAGTSSEQMSSEIPVSPSVPHRASIEPELHAGLCSEHGSYRLFWCSKCQVWLCRDCTVVEHPSGTCSVMSIKQALTKIKDKEDNLVKQTGKSRFLQVNILNDYLIKLSTYDQNHNELTDAFLEIIEKHKEAKCLLKEEQERVKGSLNESQEALEKMVTANKMLMEDNTVEGITTARHGCQKSRKNMESWIKISEDELARADTTLISEKIQKKFELVLKVAGPASDIPLLPLVSSFIDRLMKVGETLVLEDLEYLLHLTPVWGLLDDGSRVAPVIVENGCLFLHALRDGPAPDNVFVMPYKNIRFLVKQPLVVFMDISSEDQKRGCVSVKTEAEDDIRSLLIKSCKKRRRISIKTEAEYDIRSPFVKGYQKRGRVFIKTEGEDDIRSPFIKRCSGEDPNSYINSKMIQVLEKNGYGERVCGGGDGSLGKVIEPIATVQQAVRNIKTHKWVTKCTFNGLTSFAIWHKINHYQSVINTSRETLGWVTDGLNVIEDVAKNPNITDVTISDCGLVIKE